MTPPARPGRNDACHCGSGQKYKKCHLEEDERADAAARARDPMLKHAEAARTRNAAESMKRLTTGYPAPGDLMGDLDAAYRLVSMPDEPDAAPQRDALVHALAKGGPLGTLRFEAQAFRSALHRHLLNVPSGQGVDLQKVLDACVDTLSQDASPPALAESLRALMLKASTPKHLRQACLAMLLKDATAQAEGHGRVRSLILEEVFRAQCLEELARAREALQTVDARAHDAVEMAEELEQSGTAFAALLMRIVQEEVDQPVAAGTAPSTMRPE